MIRKIIASIALLVGASFVFAADDVLTDLTSSRLPSGGVYRVTTDGTSATLTVNKITASSSITLPAASVANAALVGKTALYTTVTPTVVTNANGGTNVVTFSVFDLAGTAVTTPTAIRFWISDDGQGTPAAVAGDVAISGGVELQEVLNKGDYWVMCTNLLGTVVATITDTPGGTNYIHAMAPCGKITKVTSAFRVP